MKAWLDYRHAVTQKHGESTHRQDFGLGDVPEGFPEMDVQVLSDAFELCASQLGVDGVLP